MKYAQIRKYDIANGPGIRTTLFVSGCTHNCKNCFNKEYQNFNFGKLFTDEVQDTLIQMIQETGHFSLLGGEPFQCTWDIVPFLQRIKEETNADIWCWSGYTFEELTGESTLLQKTILQYIDTLVDGRFQECFKNISLKFRGSSNQRIIDVKRSLNDEKVVERTEYYK